MDAPRSTSVKWKRENNLPDARPRSAGANAKGKTINPSAVSRHLVHAARLARDVVRLVGTQQRLVARVPRRRDVRHTPPRERRDRVAAAAGGVRVERRTDVRVEALWPQAVLPVVVPGAPLRLAVVVVAARAVVLRTGSAVGRRERERRRRDRGRVAVRRVRATRIGKHLRRAGVGRRRRRSVRIARARSNAEEEEAEEGSAATREGEGGRNACAPHRAARIKERERRGRADEELERDARLGMTQHACKGWASSSR